MKIASVIVTRLSNKYLREYVEYYKNIGVDKMYFYDNNQENEERVADVLLDYIFDGFVEVVQFHDVDGRIQEKAYQDFYDKHGKDYDWICVFDDDEYVTINSEENLKEFLSRPMFSSVNGVCFPMINFCDSNVIVNDKNTRLDVYTEVKDIRNIWHNSHYKTIVRGNLNVRYTKGDYFTSDGEFVLFDCQCHLPCIDGEISKNIVDCDGNAITTNVSTFMTAFGTRNAYLKHIPTGCIDDFINMKMKRDWPDTNNKQHFGYDYFLRYNNDSPEKYNYFLTHTQTN